jgi:hypothetical protein
VRTSVRNKQRIRNSGLLQFVDRFRAEGADSPDKGDHSETKKEQYLDQLRQVNLTK